MTMSYDGTTAGQRTQKSTFLSHERQVLGRSRGAKHSRKLVQDGVVALMAPVYSCRPRPNSIQNHLPQKHLSEYPGINSLTALGLRIRIPCPPVPPFYGFAMDLNIKPLSGTDEVEVHVIFRMPRSNGPVTT